MGYLEGCSAEIVYPSPAIFYYDVYDSIKPFVDSFPEHVTGLNAPAAHTGRIVWTCWWQGEETAPDIVKACWESQRRNLPDGAEHIVVTQENYSRYVTIPEYVLNRFRDGQNNLAHLADALPDECWTLPLYTWRFDNTQFNSRAIWTTWFLASPKGGLLWQFVMEAFFFYFSVHARVKYYFTIDYFIAICSNLFEEVLEQFGRIPYNNETSVRLNEHLYEPYSERKWLEYCEGQYPAPWGVSISMPRCLRRGD